MLSKIVANHLHLAMKLSEVKTLLPSLARLDFKLENGQSVPEHFHVTEVGTVTKKFIDCGGTIREEQKVNFQLWSANDYEHQLKPNKLLKIIELSEAQLGLQDAEVEVEYQGDTIGKYALVFDGQSFILLNQTTDCLAQDKCGIEPSKVKFELGQIGSKTCTPGGGCC